VAKILVADDNSNIQKMVGLALKDQGIDVVAVGNGEAAVRKIADVHPDLVLADVFMPVRNGYEVCRYVKEDPKYSHIPVILLVGAFDPLDEQEAQRVGADGVLKKPFVPPDPLISMVKSALARVGVQIGVHPEKSPEPAARPASEMLHPMLGSKLAALAPEKTAEVEPEPMEDFPAPPEQVRIAAGHEPVAFGSLLETPEVEDDAAFLPKGREIEERNWGEEEAEEEAEVAEEEESPRGGWRKDGGHTHAVDEGEETPSRVSDWRDAAFHGDAPTTNVSSSRWVPAVEEPSFAEAAHAPAVAVSTLEDKHVEAPAPFSGDAWAAAMAAGVEEKLAQAREAAEAAKETQGHAEAKAEVEEAPSTALVSTEEAHAEEPVKATETANGWYSVSSSPWDAEAKKASLLAATWDTPAAEPAPPTVEQAETVVEEVAAPAVEEASHYEGSPAEIHVEHHEASYAAHTDEGQVASFSQAYEAERVETHEEAPAAEGEIETPVETLQAAETPVAETHEEEAAAAQPKSWENAWEAREPVSAGSFAEAAQEEPPQAAEEHIAAREEEAVEAAQPAPIIEHVSETVAAAAEPEAQQPDMDALVARVLEKMNPDVLQKMTREILRPVIEAIIHEELNSKKS
jgi:CheY-like chemotaxis protein